MIRSAVAIVAAFVLVLERNDNGASLRPTTRDIDIVAHDYAFSAPSALPAGQTTFRFTNKGKVIHELALSLLRDGTTTRAVMSALNARTPLKPLIEASVGILIAKAGQRSSVGLSTDLLAGRDYLVICRFQDSASAPMHSRLGMITVVHVTPAKVVAKPEARLDTIVGIDYAFKAPLTLAPGPHTLTLVNEGTVLHELNVALLRPGVTTNQAVKVMKADGDLDGLVDEWMGVLFAPAGRATIGRLKVTLLPEREYLITCGLTDHDHAPPHLALGMFGTVRTPKVMRTGR